MTAYAYTSWESLWRERSIEALSSTVSSHVNRNAMLSWRQHQTQPCITFIKTFATAAKRKASPTAVIESSRRQKLRERRKHRRLRLQEESVRDSLRVLEDLPRRATSDFGQFFDTVMPPYTLVRMDEVLERIESKAQLATTAMPLPTVLQTVLHATNPSDELQIHVLQFLLFNHAAPTSRAELAVDPSAVDTIMLAREKAVLHALFWNKTDLRSISQDPMRILEPLQKHRTKSEEERRKEAVELASFLRNNLPTKYHKALMGLLENYIGNDTLKIDDERTPATLEEVYEPERVDRPPMRLLGPALYRVVRTHLDLVGPKVAEFFYLSIPSDDADVQAAAHRWDNSREKFANTLMKWQEDILTAVRTPRENLYLDDNSDTTDDETEELDPQQDLPGKENGKQDTTKAQEKKKASRKKLSHVKYQVTMSDADRDKIDVSQSPPFAVFLENLPIDTTNHEIRELYSRCGRINSIQIFNQRPDLDPGPLSQEKLNQRRKKQLRSVSSTKRGWQRPKTPVYAIVEFADESGFKRAIDDNLRIFGMIIRKHPVRSIPASRTTSLFIESLGEGPPCLELEYELERKLGLQVGIVSGQSSKDLVSSCEIKFPSFDVAWQAFSKLEKLNAVKKSRGKLQWFRTLRDAEEWWTRERGFDY